MAVVPQAQAQVDIRPLQPNYVRNTRTADDFGAAKGRGMAKAGAALQNAGDALGDVVLREQAEDNERGAKESEIKLRNRYNTVLYGDGTAENPGYLNSQGENAVKNQAAAQEALGKIREEILKEAPNDRVREMFGTTSAILQGDYVNALGKHATTQREVANDATSQARMNKAIDAGALAWNDPEMLATSQGIVQNEVLDMAERKGWSVEVTVSKLKEAQTSLYAGAIQAALPEDPDAALAMFQKYRPGMTAEASAVLGRQVQEVATVKVAQDIVDEEMAKGGSTKEIGDRIRARTSGATEEKALNIAGERIREVQADFNFQESLKNAAWREEQRAITLKNQAEKEFEKSTKESFTKGVRTGTSVNDVMATLTPEQASVINQDPYFISNMERIEQAKIKGEMFSSTPNPRAVENWNKLTDVEKAQADLAALQPTLTEKEYNKVATDQQRAAQKVKDIQDSPKPYELGERYLNRFAPPALQWGANKQSERNFQIQRAVTDEMADFIQTFTSKGEVPSAEELQQKAQQLLIPIYKDGWGTSRPIIGTVATIDKMTPEEIRSVDVPATEASSSRAVAKELGIARPSDEQLARMYLSTLQGDINGVAAALGKTVPELTKAIQAVKAKTSGAN